MFALLRSVGLEGQRDSMFFAEMEEKIQASNNQTPKVTI